MPTGCGSGGAELANAGPRGCSAEEAECPRRWATGLGVGLAPQENGGPRPGSAPPGGGLEADHRAGERRRRSGVVDRLLDASSREAALRPLPRALGPSAVDLPLPLCRVVANENLVLP